MSRARDDAKAFRAIVDAMNASMLNNHNENSVLALRRAFLKHTSKLTPSSRRNVTLIMRSLIDIEAHTKHVTALMKKTVDELEQSIKKLEVPVD